MVLPAHINTEEYRETARAVGAALKRARLAAGLSQCDVEREVAVHRNTISNCEHGRFCPSLVVLLRLCKLYRVYPGTILEGIA